MRETKLSIEVIASPETAVGGRLPERHCIPDERHRARRVTAPPQSRGGNMAVISVNHVVEGLDP
jgi:hypothetical protein